MKGNETTEKFFSNEAAWNDSHCCTNYREKKNLGKTDLFRHCETTPVASYGAIVGFLESPGALR